MQSRYSCGDKLSMRGLSRQIHMQDQPLYQGNQPKRHEHLHRADDFPEPLDVMNAVVDKAENRDQQRNETQDLKPALEVTFTIAAPRRKAIEDDGYDHIDHDQNRPEGLAEPAAGGVIPVWQQRGC